MSFFDSRKDPSSRERARRTRRPVQNRKLLCLEQLEDRTVPSTITWTAGDGDWGNGANWSGGNVPGPADDAVINPGPAVTVTISSSDTASVNSLTLAGNDTLAINYGPLSLAANSSLAGSLSITDGSLTVSGAGAKATVTGPANIFGGSLAAQGGATLSLPTMTSYTSDGSTFQADGTGSVLDVSALTAFSQNSSWTINATNGGAIDLTGLANLNSTNIIYLTDTGSSTLIDSNLTSLVGVYATLDGSDTGVAASWTSFTNGSLTVTGGSYDLPNLTDVDGSNLYIRTGGILSLPGLTSYQSNANDFQADGTGSELDLSALTTETELSGWSLYVTNGATVDLSSMSSLSSVNNDSIFDAGGSTLLDGNLTSIDGFFVTLDGTDTQVANSWTSFTNDWLTIYGGSYTLPGLTDVDGSNLYVQNGASLYLPGLTSYSSNNTTFQADGTGTVLSVSALSTLTPQGSWSINVSNGAEVDLSGMTSLEGINAGITIDDYGGSTLLDPNVTSLDYVTVTLDGTDTQITNSWTSLTNGSLTIQGGAYSLPGLTDVDGSNLYAEGGSLVLPGLTSYSSSYSYFQAEGSGSELDVSALTTLTQQGSWEVDALYGGVVDLTGMTSLEGIDAGITIQDVGGSTLIDPNVTSLDYVTVTLDGTDTQITNSWTSFTNGSLTIQGGAYSLPGLTDVDGSNLYAEGGTLALPGLTSYSANYTDFQAEGSGSVLDVSSLTTLSQQGTWEIDAIYGGEVDLPGMTSLESNIYGIIINDYASSTLFDPNLTSLNLAFVTLDGTDPQGPSSWTSLTNSSLTVEGGVTTLPGLTDVDGSSFDVEGGTLALPGLTSFSSSYSYFQADGTGSVLDVSALTSVTQQNLWEIDATNGGEVNLSGMTSLEGTVSITINDYGDSTLIDPNLTSLDYVTVNLDGTDTNVANSWTRFTNSSLTVTGGSTSLPDLTDADGSYLDVESGGTLALPSLTSYTSSATIFSADGTGSVLDLSALTTLTQQGRWTIAVGDGGEIDLAAMTNLDGVDGIYIYDVNNGILFDPQLTSLNGVNVTVDGTDPDFADSWMNFTASSLSVTGGSYNLSNLTDVDGSNFYVQNGGSLQLPSLDTYSSNGSTFQAEGTGSVLDVSSLVLMTQQGPWFIAATNGGEINLSNLISLAGVDGINLTDTGGSTLLDGTLASLDGVQANFDGTDPAVGNSWTSFTNGTLDVSTGTLSFDNLGDASGSTVIVESGASLDLPLITSCDIILENGGTVNLSTGSLTSPNADASAVTLDVPSLPTGVTLTLANSGTWSGGTTVEVGPGTNVVLAGGTYTEGVTFNVGGGATVDLTGGQTSTYSGTLTGAGAGTVQITSGEIDAGVEGLTLDFPSGMFQGSGGTLGGYDGEVSNLGTISLVGGLTLGTDSTLDNDGTITESDSGFIYLQSDGISPSVLDNELGGLLLIETSAGVYGNGGTLDNAGTIRVTAGTVSGLAPSGTLDNTGTIEVDSGTLDIDDTSINQISGTTLTAGSWAAMDGATLEFPSGTDITSNAADLALGGAGSSIVGIGGLSTNSGSFTLDDGATFTTAGDFSNSGVLTLGDGGLLSVTGNFSQSSGATLSEEIGGTPESGLFGQSTVHGTATLNGTLTLTLVNGYTPSAGQSYQVMTYTGVSGNFASVTGLPSGMLAKLNPDDFELDMPLATSTVAALPAFRPASFTLSWSGSDSPGGPGIASYSVYVSDNGGLYQPLLTNTTSTSTTFTGLNGHTYGFYSVATDKAGNVQSTPSSARHRRPWTPSLRPAVSRLYPRSAPAASRCPGLAPTTSEGRGSTRTVFSYPTTAEHSCRSRPIRR